MGVIAKLKCRTNRMKTLKAELGPVRRGKGSRRVRIGVYASSGVSTVSVYPSDVRKFAFELLQVADEAEKI